MVLKGTIQKWEGVLNMYKPVDFENKLDVSSIITVSEKYKYNGESLNEVQDRVNEIIAVSRRSCVLPDVVIHSTWFTNDKEEFIEASFTVRLSLRQGSPVEHKTTFTVNADTNFYQRFGGNLAKWASEYWQLEKYTANLMELQDVFNEIANNVGVNFNILFKIGSGVIDVTDNEITLGISQAVLETLSTSDLFYSYVPGNVEVVRARVGEALKSCARPIEITKLNYYIFKELGMYSRKLYKGLVRATVNRKLDFSRVGDSYVETADYFAVIQKRAITAAEASDYAETAFIIDNVNASKAELEADKVKVLICYKVSPFNKDNVAVDVDIRDIPNITLANKVSG